MQSCMIFPLYVRLHSPERNVLCWKLCSLRASRGPPGVVWHLAFTAIALYWVVVQIPFAL